MFSTLKNLTPLLVAVLVLGQLQKAASIPLPLEKAELVTAAHFDDALKGDTKPTPTPLTETKPSPSTTKAPSTTTLTSPSSEAATPAAKTQHEISKPNTPHKSDDTIKTTDTKASSEEEDANRQLLKLGGNGTLLERLQEKLNRKNMKNKNKEKNEEEAWAGNAGMRIQQTSTKRKGSKKPAPVDDMDR